MDAYAEQLCRKPRLRFLFLELTRQCNLNCRHCGSSCPTETSRRYLRLEELRPTLDEVAASFRRSELMFCITGGEPLLCPEWEKICSYIARLGFSWGMTTNGTLIDERMVRRLSDAGMRTIGISLDGLEQTHDSFRRVPGAFQGAVRALSLLSGSGLFKAVEAVTVVTSRSLPELEEIYRLLLSLGVDSWKLTGVDPIGIARDDPSLALTPEEHLELLRFLREKRAAAPIHVTYGCAHRLPDEFDDTVRANHFLCGAGTLVASITCEGDITACLDIDERDRAVQGNIFRDSFVEVWRNRFETFRRNKALDSDFCRDCALRDDCRGDAWHTWDFAENRPRLCLYRSLGETKAAFP